MHMNELYTDEILEGSKTQDDCVFVNIGTGCGDTMTRVFRKENKWSWDEFREEFKGDM